MQSQSIRARPGNRNLAVYPHLPRTRSMSTSGAHEAAYPRVMDLKTLLIKNDEVDQLKAMQKLCKHAEDDPPFIFGWESVHNFVAQIANLPAAVAQPPFALPVPLNVRNFKAALLHYIKGPDNPSLTIGTTAIPCTQAQSIMCGCRATFLLHDPWIQAVANMGGCTPIARLYVPRPRSNTLDECVPRMLPPPTPLWH